MSLESSNRKKNNTGIGLGMLIGFATGASIAAGVYELKETTYEKYGVLPDCTRVMDAGEALQPVPDKDVTQTIGRMATCRIDDQVFRLVASKS